MSGPALERATAWTIVVGLAAAAMVAALALIIWRTPFPVSETVALLEDVARRPAASFFVPDTPYYRPLFHATLSALWNSSLPLDTRLSLLRSLHIIPPALLALLFVAHVRPRSALDAGAALLGLAVLLGSPGFRDNMEIPLSYTTVGMPLALAAWMILTAERRAWHAPVLVALAIIAIGFKEQGLAIVAVVMAAAITRAPGASRTVTAAVAVLAVAYVGLRLTWHGRLALFEQAIGLGFHEIEPREAIARYGAFPYFVYAYSAAATMANVLFSEPTGGVFSITWTVGHGVAAPWEYINAVSSLMLTSLIVWWGADAFARVRVEGWSEDARTAVALTLVLLACGALSFNYSRDRLGGMAVPFYALAAVFAVRAAATRIMEWPPARFAAGAVALVLLGGLWQTRVVGTAETLRAFSSRNQMEWLTQGPARREEFAARPVYLSILEVMRPQGIVDGAPRHTRFAPALARLFGPGEEP